MDDNSYDVDNNYTDGDYGDFYRKDGYFYNKKFGDAFKWRDEKGLIIAENTNIKNIYLKEYFKLGFDNFIFTNCTFTDIIYLQGSNDYEDNDNSNKDNKKIIFDKTITFKNCIFNNSLHFPNIIFKNKVIFENCEFNSSIKFTESQFNDKVYFKESIFYSIADFSSAHFNGGVYFNKSTFHKKASFTNTIFNKKADFNNLKVLKGGNSGFYFENNNKIPDTAEIIFDNAYFSAPIFFNGRCFKEKISFNNTTISNIFNFTDVNFGSKALLSGIKINHRGIPELELWINIFKDSVKDNYLFLAGLLNEVSKDIFRNKSRYINNKITKKDENILISRKDTAAMLGISENTLKTWTARGKSKLVFKKDDKQYGYTLASIKEYNSSQYIKDPKQKPISNYAILINEEQTITYKTPYVETKRKMYGLHLTHIPIVDNKTIVGIFSNRIESAYTYNVKMKMDLQFKEVLIEEILNVVGNNIEGFLFTKPNTSVKKVISMFLQDSQYEEGIGVIFLTHNGKANGKLVGMITADTLIKI